MSTLDSYGNTETPQQPDSTRLNGDLVEDNKRVSKLNPELWHYGVKTRVGAVPLKAVVNHLRLIAKVLEEKEGQIENVAFNIIVDEVVVKPRTVYPAEYNVCASMGMEAKP